MTSADLGTAYSGTVPARGGQNSIGGRSTRKFRVKLPGSTATNVLSGWAGGHHHPVRGGRGKLPPVVVSSGFAPPTSLGEQGDIAATPSRPPPVVQAWLSGAAAVAGQIRPGQSRDGGTLLDLLP